MTEPPTSPLYSALSTFAIFRDYQNAFESVTGLPLTFHPPGNEPVGGVPSAASGKSSFCSLMAVSNQACEACLTLQKRLESEAQLQPKTLKCFAGLCETAVPVRVGKELIAFLRTGGILIETPNQREFSKITRELVRLGTEVDLKQVEEAYFATRVITAEQYQSIVKLISIFATHLAACGDELLLKRSHAQKQEVIRARQIIDAGFRDQLSLGGVSKQVNVSAGYFGELFKKATGLTFLSYVAQLRVEKAKELLRNPGLKIGEIALDVGFQSFSQFNRTFRRLTGVSPRAYRASVAELELPIRRIFTVIPQKCEAPGLPGM